MNAKLSLVLLAHLALSTVAAAQSFSYPDFTSTSGLTLNGNAAAAGTALRVTPSASGQKGSVFTSSPVAVGGNFETTFAFQITQPSGGGADGMTFAIANDPRGATALGDGGTPLGYGHDALNPPTNAINNSLVVEIDTWLSAGDLSTNEVSVQTGGNGVNGADATYSIGRITPTVNMSDGNVHVMRLRYSPGTLLVFLDNLLTPLLSVPWDFNTGGTWVVGGGAVGGLSLIGGTSAFVGFTSSTGGAWENHDVLWWNWDSCPATATYCTAKSNSLGCIPVISATGSASASAGSGFVVRCTSVRNNKNGLLFYGVNGRNAAPFQGGFLCVAPPIKRTGASGSGGTPLPVNDCSGVYAIDMNLFAHSSGPPLPLPALQVPGTLVACQWWGRDPGFPAPNNTTLSDGLEYTVCP